jgi:hypothetical protein
MINMQKETAEQAESGNCQSTANQACESQQAHFHERIRLRAYHHWETAGRPDGHALHFWLRAETELQAEFAQQLLR